jgi:hypothetical protein
LILRQNSGTSPYTKSGTITLNIFSLVNPCREMNYVTGPQTETTKGENPERIDLDNWVVMPPVVDVDLWDKELETDCG